MTVTNKFGVLLKSLVVKEREWNIYRELNGPHRGRGLTYKSMFSTIDTKGDIPCNIKQLLKENIMFLAE